MVFNVLTGNTDDHLRNHGFLRVRDGWRLSPAYDLNPNPKAFAARAHILPILPGNHHPALERCVDAVDAGTFRAAPNPAALLRGNKARILRRPGESHECQNHEFMMAKPLISPAA
jgi:serine/threonine-protein kinase HipA